MKKPILLLVAIAFCAFGLKAQSAAEFQEIKELIQVYEQKGLTAEVAELRQKLAKANQHTLQKNASTNSSSKSNVKNANIATRKPIQKVEPNNRPALRADADLSRIEEYNAYELINLLEPQAAQMLTNYFNALDENQKENFVAKFKNLIK